MKLLVITHVLHVLKADKVFAYAPYIREMNIWLRHTGRATILAPRANHSEIQPIDAAYAGEVAFVEVSAFNVLDIRGLWQALKVLPLLLSKLYKAMQEADHIHLRCPGNMGLLGCMVQIAFPHKQKTAKYAGNWDSASPQPWSYRLQRWILNNPFLTRNMRVLVYGQWPDQSRNILPFFTASYRESEWVDSPPRSLEEGGVIQLIFVGSLVAGKRPMIAVETVEVLQQWGIPAVLHLYGDGLERGRIAQYIQHAHLAESVFLHGNTSSAELKQAYQRSHFLIFPSKSEGWPKAVAEAMCWGCLPVTTAVSCVPEMLGNGTRGELIEADASAIAHTIRNNLDKPGAYREKCIQAMVWARQFTLERFELEIQQLL
jgi:glycosyltransferase involved in cell wall biosynthesis